MTWGLGTRLCSAGATSGCEDIHMTGISADERTQ